MYQLRFLSSQGIFKCFSHSSYYVHVHICNICIIHIIYIYICVCVCVCVCVCLYVLNAYSLNSTVLTEHLKFKTIKWMRLILLHLTLKKIFYIHRHYLQTVRDSFMLLQSKILSWWISEIYSRCGVRAN